METTNFSGLVATTKKTSRSKILTATKISGLVVLVAVRNLSSKNGRFSSKKY